MIYSTGQKYKKKKNLTQTILTYNLFSLKVLIIKEVYISIFKSLSLFAIFHNFINLWHFFGSILFSHFYVYTRFMGFFLISFYFRSFYIDLKFIQLTNVQWMHLNLRRQQLEGVVPTFRDICVLPIEIYQIL